jgi:hypothetical protein
MPSAVLSSTAFCPNPRSDRPFSSELNSVSGFDRRYLPIMHWLPLCTQVRYLTVLAVSLDPSLMSQRGYKIVRLQSSKTRLGT